LKNTLSGDGVMMTMSFPAPPPPAADEADVPLEATGADELASLDAGALDAADEAAAEVAGADTAADAEVAAAEVAAAVVAAAGLEAELLAAGVLLLPQAAVTVSRAAAPAEQRTARHGVAFDVIMWR
jgi:hypothetical protein